MHEQIAIISLKTSWHFFEKFTKVKNHILASFETYHPGKIATTETFWTTKNIFVQLLGKFKTIPR